jgi:hypothetical protein
VLGAVQEVGRRERPEADDVLGDARGDRGGSELDDRARGAAAVRNLGPVGEVLDAEESTEYFTTPSMSAGVRPASAIAASIASRASATPGRLASVLNVVEPIPTIAALSRSVSMLISLIGRRVADAPACAPSRP